MPSKPKVLVTRDLPGDAISWLRGRFNVDLPSPDENIGRERLLEHLPDKQGLLCLLTDRIDAEVLAIAPLLKVISVCAVGYNNVDVKEATRRGMIITNTPGVLRETTADLAWALLLATARRIPEGDRMVRSGRFLGWSPSLLLGHDVHGKTLGIVGMGDIGTAVARRAAGFGMRILYHNRNPSPLAAEVRAEMVSLDHLLSDADFVSLHVPLSQSTRHLIGKRELDLMKPTAVLINVSRGEVIDEAALAEALKQGRIAGAGLDVFENEPKLAPGLVGLENVVLTPHIGSASVETRQRMARIAVDNLADALEGRTPKHMVNPQVLRDI
ncbi:MAG: D-glycerate dehydrogenase [Methanomassiliicoccales archaeon]|nr:D-glycerate dehydrogenase [Methanomassiliicoccales archaeon]